MDTLMIKGGKLLSGAIQVSGSKNAALAIVPASLLARKKITLYNIPDIEDIRTLLGILRYLEVDYDFDGDKLVLDSSTLKKKPLTDEKITSFRASYYFMGVFLALFGEVEIATPGGCNFGERPIDYHLTAFEKLGATILLQNNIYHIKASTLKQGHIELPFPSVGASINLLLATFFIPGGCSINNIALEPEVEELIKFLNALGGNIMGRGTRQLIIQPALQTKQCAYWIMNDRIEAGTYAIIGALIGDNLIIEGVNFAHLIALFNVFNTLGVRYTLNDQTLKISKSIHLNPITVKTLPYPFFPTDLQQPLTVLLSQCYAQSSIIDTIYTKRNSHLQELKKMKFLIEQEEEKIIIKPSPDIIGGEIEGKDLRGSAALICAALTAQGVSKMDGYKYLKRGYVDMIGKLQNVGAQIYEEEN